MAGQPKGRAPHRSRRRPLAWRVGRPRTRLRSLLLAMAFMFSLLVGRAVQVQAIDASANAATAAQQITVARNLPALRGTITDRSGLVLAFSEAAVNIIADPMMIASNGKADGTMTSKDKEFAAAAPAKIAAILAAHLGGAAEDYVPALTRPESKYSIVKKNVQAATFSDIAKELAAQKLIGVYRESDPIRTYPNGSLAANVIGFVNDQNEGAGGLEYALNTQLSGTPGREVYMSSPDGRIPLGDQVLTSPVNGVDVQLTLDSEMQWMAEQRLQQALNESQADWGTVIVMNPKTGEVLAMANAPSFDSNTPGTAAPTDLGNRAVTDAYEPGSVEKVLTFAALMDAGVVLPEDVVVVPPSVKSGDFDIHDAEPHGTETMYARGVFANSSNIGTILLTRGMDKGQFVSYLRSFGLGQKTGIGLPGEADGQLPGTDLEDYQRDSIAFGMSLAVTPIQEAAAVAAIVNGGVYNEPTIVKKMTAADGTDLTPAKAAPRRVISEGTSAAVRDLMEQMALTRGKTLAVDGYRVGGKTGTANRVDPSCGCYQGLVLSFMGVAPIEDPQVLIYVVVNNPRVGAFGIQVAAPVWVDLMKLALPRYGVPPSATEGVKLPLAP